VNGYLGKGGFEMSVLTPKELDRRLHEFMQFHRNVMRRFFSGCGLFNGHPFMLFLIRETPGITPAQLAKRMDIAPASATISVKRMEAAGLLRREADEHDRRVLHLFLTPDGIAMDDLCRRGKDFTEETLFRGFSNEERQTLADLLSRMQQNLADADIDGWLCRHSPRKDDSV
jgi:DNA-binding MarR family transcriptional regulator